MSQMLLLVCFEGIARLSSRVWRRFVRGSREISLVPSLHRASTDALIHDNFSYIGDAIDSLSCLEEFSLIYLNFNVRVR